MGVDGAFGRVGLEWVTQFRTSTTFDGGIYVHNGQSLKMVLNTPDDVMDILSFRSERFYQRNIYIFKCQLNFIRPLILF